MVDNAAQPLLHVGVVHERLADPPLALHRVPELSLTHNNRQGRLARADESNTQHTVVCDSQPHSIPNAALLFEEEEEEEDEDEDEDEGEGEGEGEGDVKDEDEDEDEDEEEEEDEEEDEEEEEEEEERGGV